MPGVLEVFAHDNRPDVASEHEKYTDEAASPGSPFRPLYDDQILFAGQPIALVVAEEFEIARLAATLVDIDYEAEEAITDIDTQLDKAFSPPKKRLPGWDPEPRGDADKALSQAPISIRQRISHPDRAPQSMENFGTTAVSEGDRRLTVYRARRKALRTATSTCATCSVSPRTRCVFCLPMSVALSDVGLRPNYQLFMAVLAAIAAQAFGQGWRSPGRQMFTLGYHPQTIQTLSLGAEKDRGLVAFKHDAIANASRFEDYRAYRSFVWRPLSLR